jgi:hypothetical protein
MRSPWEPEIGGCIEQIDLTCNVLQRARNTLASIQRDVIESWPLGQTDLNVFVKCFEQMMED